MKRLFFLALFCTSPAIAAPRQSLTQEQAGQVRCVAALALAAYDQQRGAPGWEGFPWLPERGARFSDGVTSKLAKQTGRQRADIESDIKSAIADLQNESIEARDPMALTHALVRQCIVMLDAEIPPPAPPSLPSCAAMVAIAYDEVAAREGNSNGAKQLSNMAAILDGKAREQLRAEGKTDAEADIVIGSEKERILAASSANRERGDRDDLDFESCFARAADGAKGQGH